MFLNQIEAFVNVVKYKSFSMAAKALFLSQPTISSNIKALENELGIQLIVRTTKDVVLSDAGKVFYEYALELLHTRDVAIQKIQDYTHDISGVLPIAASTVPAQYVLPQVLASILNIYPKISVKISQMDSQAVISSVEDFEYEFGIAGTKISGSKCTFEPLLTDHLVLITPNTVEFRSYNGIFPVEAFKKIPFVWREDGSGTRKEAAAFLDSLNLSINDLNIVTEMPTTESIKQAVHYGLGASIVSRKSVEDYEKFGYVLTFDFDSEYLNRNLYLVYHKNRMLSPVAGKFVEQLRLQCQSTSSDI